MSSWTTCGHLGCCEDQPVPTCVAGLVMRVQSLRSDPLPLTWEIPTALILCWALGAVIALPVGQGISHVLMGEPFAWPAGRLPQSVVGTRVGPARRRTALVRVRRPTRHGGVRLHRGGRGRADRPGRLGCLRVVADHRARWPRSDSRLEHEVACRAGQGCAPQAGKDHQTRPCSALPVHRSRPVVSAPAPRELGWRLGRSRIPRGVELWVPFDRTAGVYGPQGSGKTLDLLTPALLERAGGGAGDAHQARGPVPHPGSPRQRRAAGARPRPVRPRPRDAGARVGPRRRLRRLDGRRAPREGVHGRHRRRAP